MDRLLWTAPETERTAQERPAPVVEVVPELSARDLQLAIVDVQVPYPGASPEQVEDGILLRCC